MGVIIVGIALLTTLYKYIEDNTYEARLEKMEEAAEEATAAAEEAASAYQELISTLDGLDDAYDNIENLTKGTSEWWAAVNSLNESLYDLIDTYDLLYGED